MDGFLVVVRCYCDDVPVALFHSRDEAVAFVSRLTMHKFVELASLADFPTDAKPLDDAPPTIVRFKCGRPVSGEEYGKPPVPELRESPAHTCTDASCPGCIRAVQAALEFDIADGEEEFDEGFGDLIDDLHDATAAIHRARREKFTRKHDEIANSWEAATKLVKIAAAVAAVAATIQCGRKLTSEVGRDD